MVVPSFGWPGVTAGGGAAPPSTMPGGRSLGMGPYESLPGSNDAQRRRRFWWRRGALVVVGSAAVALLLVVACGDGGVRRRGYGGDDDPLLSATAATRGTWVRVGSMFVCMCGVA